MPLLHFALTCRARGVYRGVDPSISLIHGPTVAETVFLRTQYSGVPISNTAVLKSQQSI